MGRRVPDIRHGRSQITNGRRVLPAGIVDGRSSEYRRFKDLIAAHSSDLGSFYDQLSEAQCALVRRSAALQVEIERMEARFAEKGGASPRELGTYLSACNVLKRLCESLGTHRGRKARDVTPDLSTYIAGKNGHAHGRNRARTIDHEEDA